MKSIYLLLLFLVLAISITSYPQKKTDAKPEVTFIELGSVNCIPCKMMQPVMKSVEEKYGTQVKVIFYDVWKTDQKKYAHQYGIKLIPTQVFLDKNGKEFFRHEGFYPEAEIDKLLKTKGLSPVNKEG
jgi:thioredoxin 1